MFKLSDYLVELIKNQISAKPILAVAGSAPGCSGCTGCDSCSGCAGCDGPSNP